MPSYQWDIFCAVIDNYGDAGVCWRLASQLSQDYGQRVRLFIDKPEVLATLLVRPVSSILATAFDSIEIQSWEQAHYRTADVVIEAFACELPEHYLHAMASTQSTPLWINLEYLATEGWADDYHGLSSIHPQTGLLKYFFWPGFSPKTGGLLREKSLAKRCYANRSHPRQLSIQPNIHITPHNDALLVSFFAYPNAPLTSLLSAWIQGKQAIHCLIPACVQWQTIEQMLGQKLPLGKALQAGALTIQSLPFLSQTAYDQLLWHCDINFVRGEDSFVRAHWAARPLVWQAYPQAENAHLDKLAAFLQNYLASSSVTTSEAVSRFWQGWNRQEDCARLWPALLEVLPDWQQHANTWSQQLAQQESLVAQLMQLAQLKRVAAI